MSKQHSKQAIRQGKLRKITKCLLTRFHNSKYTYLLLLHLLLLLRFEKTLKFCFEHLVVSQKRNSALFRISALPRIRALP